PSLLDATLGEPFVIEYFRSSDVLLVLTDGGIGIVSAAEVDGFDSSVPTDPTTPVTVLTSLPKTEPLAGAADSREWRRRGSLLASAQLVGNSAGSTALAVAYAKERQQFGRPIGSFQGLKHLLADSWIRTEVARSSVWSAGVSLDEGSNSFVERALSGGRVTAARAATENAKTCIQVHGGMGFTWEINAHLFLKRAWILETQFGSVDDAVRAVAIDFATEASE
ncbi:MAG: acyl-CoA dehydrogenase family protein, partial [Acidimicrobiales bacterium]